MPSKIQLDENLWFLYTCIQKSDMKSIDFAAVAELANIKPPAARMRYTRLKRQIEDGTLTGQHGNTFVPSSSSATPIRTPSNPTPPNFITPSSTHPISTPSTSGLPSFNPSEIHLKYPLPNNAKRRKIESSDWISVSSSNSKGHQDDGREKQETREENEGLGKGVSKSENCDPKASPEAAKEPGEIEDSSEDDLENIPLSKIRRPNPNPTSPSTTSTTLHLPRPSPHPSISHTNTISSTQTSPLPSASSPISISSTQTSPSLRTNTKSPPYPFQNATLPYPPPRPPMSSPAIYHGFRGAKRGYRYFQAGNQGRGSREYVSPYRIGFKGERGEGVLRMGGVSEPFRSARPVDSIYDREFGRPFARGAWGVEVRRDEGS